MHIAVREIAERERSVAATGGQDCSSADAENLPAVRGHSQPDHGEIAFLASVVALQVAATSAYTALHQIAQRKQGETENVVMKRRIFGGASCSRKPPPLIRAREVD